MPMNRSGVQCRIHIKSIRGAHRCDVGLVSSQKGKEMPLSEIRREDGGAAAAADQDHPEAECCARGESKSVGHRNGCRTTHLRASAAVNFSLWPRSLLSPRETPAGQAAER